MEWADWIYFQKTLAFLSIILGAIMTCAFLVYRFSGGKCARIIQAGLVLASKFNQAINALYRIICKFSIFITLPVTCFEFLIE